MPIDKRWFLLPMVVSIGIGVVTLVAGNLFTAIASFFFALVCLVSALSRDDETREHPQP